jgi:uncharacterized protein YdeI (YjbR/CyaY-like superfamily)
MSTENKWTLPEQWVEELDFLKSILDKTPLEATVKWGVPTYTHKKKNVVGIAGFKNFCTLWFYNGVFLKDPKKVLMNAQEGKTKALRQWRFTTLDEIKKHQQTIYDYVMEALEVENAGLVLKTEPKKLVIPAELQARLDDDAELSKAFLGLTPGCQREYADHIGEAKKEETRLRRLEKVVPMILAGVGMNDKYKQMLGVRC